MTQVTGERKATIIGLLEEILQRPGMSHERVARESKIPTDAGGQAIRNELKRRHRIYVKLVDWVLEQTVFAGDPIERALVDLKAAGLSVNERETVRRVILQIAGKMPIGTSIKKESGTKEMMPPAVGEESPIYPLPQRIIKPVNRRSEIPVFKIVSRKKQNVTALPKWLDLAIGEGEDLQRCEDLVYFEGIDDFKGLHTATIRGDSMWETLHPGDLVVLKPLPAGAVLKKLDDPRERTPMDVWRAKFDIREGDIVVVSIRDRAPTLKRVHYDTSRGERQWKLQIVADNPASGWNGNGVFQIDDEDWVVFHAKMIGRGANGK